MKRGKRCFYKSIAAAAAVLITTLTVVISAWAAYPESLVPVGSAVGIRIKTRGVIVVNTEQTSGQSPAEKAGIRPGDIIVSVDGTSVTSASELTDGLQQGGNELDITVLRDGTEQRFAVAPETNGGRRTIGVWVRDSISGIGTVTFYDAENGVFGALGHCVDDTDTGVRVPVEEGRIARAQVGDVVKGSPGSPGQLGGVFDPDEAMGEIGANTEFGIFGTAISMEGESVPVASPGDIVPGKAEIISTVEGDRPQSFSVEIIRVYSDAPDGRSMMLRVTDEKLLAATGGIVQGMSGSPIIQNGKLIGAVTHVLVNDPAKGYGISIDKMLEAAGYTDGQAA